MGRNTFDRWWLGTSGLIALLVITALLTFQNTRRLNMDAVWVAHTHEVMDTLQEAIGHLREAEAVQRTYLIMGGDSPTPAVTENFALARRKVQKVKGLTGDNPLQQGRLPDIERRMDALAELWAKTARVRTEQGFDAAKKIVDGGQANTAMAELRGRLQEMDESERTLLAEREERRRHAYHSALLTGALSGSAAVMGVVAFMVLLRRHLVARTRAAFELAELAERLRITLASIGDAVITTDMDGRITSLNTVAESLTGWSTANAVGQSLDTVFKIVKEETRQSVESPATRALKEGVIVGLANHTLLIARDGTERPIDDSAAPIRCKEGEVVGCVLVFRDISERRAAELGVEAEQERFRLAADAVNGIIYEYEIPTGHVVRTRGLSDVLGYRADEVPPTAVWWLEQIHPDDREASRRQFERAAALGNHVVTEYRVRHKDGRWLHVEDRAVLVRGGDGQPVKIVGCTVDMTGHKRAEQELREKEEQLRLAVRAADMIVFRWNIATDIVTRLGDTPADAPLGPHYTFRQAMDTIHPDDRPGVLQRVETALRGEGPDLYVSEHRHNETPDRSWRWILVHGRFHRDEQGRPLTMLGLGIDITATKTVEAETRRRETFIRGVLGSITDAFSVLDKHWRFTFVNDEFARRNVKECDELVGRHLWEMFPETEGNEAYVQLHRAMAARVALEYQVYYEPWQRWFLDSVYPTDDGGLAVYSRDITEQKKVEAALEESADTLGRERERLAVALLTGGLGVYEWWVGEDTIWWSPETFAVFGVAPESFQPTVEAFNALVHPDDRPELWRKTEESLARQEVFDHEYRIVRPDGEVRWIYNRSHLGVGDGGRVERITGVTADITARKRAEEELRLTNQRFDLAVKCSQVVLWQQDLELRFTWLHNPAPGIDGSNAVGKRDADLLERAEDADVIVGLKRQVIRSGVFLRQEFSPQIQGVGHCFEVLMEPSRDAAGLITGITAESGGHGQGSCFVVHLPVVLSVSTDRPDGYEANLKPAASYRILFVDDNRDGADSLAEMLKFMGNDTQTAHDGVEAVEMAEAFQPDVILMDIGMPKLNGYDASRRIREQPWGKNIVIVAQTGWGLDNDKRNSQDAGFTFHMVKPVDPAALLKLLSNLNLAKA